MANTWQTGGRRPEVLHVVGRVLVGPTEIRDELWVVGGRITFDAPIGPADIRTIRGWVLPGLVDAHCHVGLGKQGAVDHETTLAQAVADRDVGALLLRDAGSPADTRWIDDRDDLPRLVRAGRHIARSRRYIRNYAEEVEPDGLAAEVVRQAGRGDGWVKLVGDWIDRSLGDLAPCWPPVAVAEAIAAAHAAGARVTAHCFAEDSLPALAAAGIDCVEHATGLSDDTIAVFAARGIAIVPTLVNIATFPEIAAPAEDRFPQYHKHMLALHARRYATIGAAYEAGIPIYVGTDAGGSLPHGLVGAEVAELVKAGLPPLAALAAATWSARAWLGFPGLDEGAPADLVVYPEDPRVDPAVLAAPDLIVLRGQPLTG
ncbi:amidohydrolase family protein [Pseudofrankia inefficax]|uniref:Amidohydrolase n=1 Tax=Pseudofrankia inefficax (strain DSM 45817 / CECT 9037 / DDB 130130 / EuI1c) TaxID=298654 RepID=E3IVX1_PSEI1|nr:amidohydrolase family protein [Pseudofrankia inefficax]ADP83773.1 amidohydrolase [Pseudofrankia inefficax]